MCLCVYVPVSAGLQHERLRAVDARVIICERRGDGVALWGGDAQDEALTAAWHRGVQGSLGVDADPQSGAWDELRGQ